MSNNAVTNQALVSLADAPAQLRVASDQLRRHAKALQDRYDNSIDRAFWRPEWTARYENAAYLDALASSLEQLPPGFTHEQRMAIGWAINESRARAQDAKTAEDAGIWTAQVDALKPLLRDPRQSNNCSKQSGDTVTITLSREGAETILTFAEAGRNRARRQYERSRLRILPGVTPEDRNALKAAAEHFDAIHKATEAALNNYTPERG